MNAHASLTKCMCGTWKVYECYQNVIEPQATEYYQKKYIQIHSTGTVGLAS